MDRFGGYPKAAVILVTTAAATLTLGWGVGMRTKQCDTPTVDLLTFRTRSFFPEYWEFISGNCTWIVDSGYPLSQLCGEEATIGPYAVYGYPNAPVCASLPSGTCGILGLSFIGVHNVSGTNLITSIGTPSVVGSACFAANVSATVPGTNVYDNVSWTNTFQVSVRYQTSHGPTVYNASCFVDTGGGASLMSRTLATRLGLPWSTWHGDTIGHVNASGHMVPTIAYVGSNDPPHSANAYIGNVNLTPSRFVVVPDDFNSLWGMECSVGTRYLMNIRYVHLHADVPLGQTMGDAELCML